MTTEINIICVPPFMVRDALPRCRRHLERGAHVGKIELATLLERLEAGDALLWLACETYPPRILGVFVSELQDDCLFVSHCAGEELRKWAIQARDRMTSYAQAERRPVVRYMGRKGWSRVFGAVRAVVMPAGGKGQFYERAAA